jgi:peptide/nickel transport system permease protein
MRSGPERTGPNPGPGPRRHRIRRGTPAGGWLGLVMTGLVVTAALFAPQLAPHAYDDQDLGRALLPPFWMSDADPAFLLGTDYLGRDLLSRLVYAARTSLLVGAAAVVVAGMVGVAVGLVAGFVGGGVDSVVMRLVDMQLAFPPIVLAISVLTTIGTSLGGIVVVLGVIGWVQYARVIRGQTLSLREREFVLAARALGAGVPRILWRHVLPNALGPVLAIATLNVSSMILAEASLSFLGVGVRPPTPAWGSMLSEGRDVFRIAWWNAVFPGLAIAWTVFGINLAGDAWHAVPGAPRSAGGPRARA